MGSYEIKSIADINGDKVKDICISCNGGGNAVSWSARRRSNVSCRGGFERGAGSASK